VGIREIRGFNCGFYDYRGSSRQARCYRTTRRAA